MKYLALLLLFFTGCSAYKIDAFTESQVTVERLETLDATVEVYDFESAKAKHFKITKETFIVCGKGRCVRTEDIDEVERIVRE